MADFSHTLEANSDQINAADFAAPMVVAISAAKLRNDDKQPLAITLEGVPKAWYPCKTVRRLMAGMWGRDTDDLINRKLELYSDPSVEYGGKRTGGIRILRATGIDSAYKVVLPNKRGKYTEHVIKVLPADAPVFGDRGPDALDAWAEAQGVTADEIDLWAHSRNSRKPSMANAQDRDKLAGWLKGAKGRDTINEWLSGHRGASTPADEPDGATIALDSMRADLAARESEGFGGMTPHRQTAGISVATKLEAMSPEQVRGYHAAAFGGEE